MPEVRTTIRVIIAGVYPNTVPVVAHALLRAPSPLLATPGLWFAVFA
jgi:hypothetical protein